MIVTVIEVVSGIAGRNQIRFDHWPRNLTFRRAPSRPISEIKLSER